MTITNTDIILYQSQDNTDNDNGGGSRTNVPVADGAVNNLFPDISRVDTVAGDVALRKVFPVVNTDNRDIYFGAHAIIRKKPTDPNVSALLFFTDDPIDTRLQAQNKIESYLIPSFQSSFYLFGANAEGAKSVTFLQRIEEEIPLVGEVYVLQEGSATQYIRAVNIETREILIFFNGADYRRRRIIMEIDQPLQQTFNGSAFSPTGQLGGTANTFNTQIADTAKFYGIADLTQDAMQGDTALQLDSIFEQLVPAATQQVPLINNDALQNGLTVLRTDNPVIIQQPMGVLQSSSQVFQFNTPVQPGTISGLGLVDNGSGIITRDSDSTFRAQIDYATGQMTWLSGALFPNFSSVFYAVGQPVEVSVQHSTGVLVTVENQGLVYIQNVAPVPDPYSVYVDFRSGGKWYRITGQPDRTLFAPNGLGAGLVNVNGDGTATISVTLGAVPDIGSTVIFSWGSVDATTKISDLLNTTASQWFEWQLPHQNIDRDSCIIEYQPEASGILSTLNFAGGNKPSVSNLTFELDAVNGVLKAYPNSIQQGTLVPTRFTTSSVQAINKLGLNYNYAGEQSPGSPGERKFLANVPFTNPNTGVFVIDLGEAVNPSGIKISVTAPQIRAQGANGTSVKPPETWPNLPNVLVSDENGILRESPTGVGFGTVNANGTITITSPTTTRQVSQTEVIDGKRFVKMVTAQVPYFTVTRVDSVEFTTAPIPAGQFTLTYTGDLPHVGNCIYKILTTRNLIPTFVFSIFDEGFNNQSIAIRGLKVNGTNVFQNLTVPRQVGSFDPSTGLISIQWNQQVEFLGNNAAMRLRFSDVWQMPDVDNDAVSVRRATFKTGATDLVTSSFILRYTTANGTFVATTNANGTFTGTDIDVAASYVDTITGAAYIEFTADIIPQSLKFDAVAQTTLPLDANLLGLNPVRLPPDGRVPIFYPGAFVVVFNEQTTSIPTPTAGSTVTLARQGQAYIEVVDANGMRLAYDQYTTDRVAGTLTFANPLNLVNRQGDPLTAPYSVIDRVEDMGLCTDASVTGRISISSVLSRDYLAGQTSVASALVWGDIGARVFSLFSQQSFNGWFDEPNTSSINAQFDNINFPIQINNKDSFTGRWAFIFTSSTTVDVVSERLGTVLEDAPIATDISPVNPATGLPYFTVPSGGWGGGWVTSNVLRFNTESGSQNMWVIRTVQSGALSEQTDSIDIEIRGDVN